MKGIIYNPIGIIHAPHKNMNDMPIQPSAAKGIKGMVEIYPEYETDLKDLILIFRII